MGDLHCAYDEKEAVARCKKCGNPVCPHCRRVFRSDTICKVCTVRMYSRHCTLVRHDSDEVKKS